ncbi:MAG: VanZ family protein [Candidatus Binatia bacterium]
MSSIARARGISQGGSRSKWLILTSWSLSLLYMAAIFFLSTQSDFPLPYSFSGGDFFLHVVEYSVLGLLLSWSLANSGVTRRLIFYVFLMGLFYGITDELHQYFVPERTASLLDITADGLGSFLGSYSFHLLRSIKSAT